MNGLENIHLMASPKKRKMQLFPPIEVSNKANILSRGLHGSTINTFDVHRLENEPQTPPNMNLLTADQILAPVRSRRRPIGSPKPKAQTSLMPPDFSISASSSLSKSLPTIVVGHDDDGPNLQFHSSTFRRSPTPIPQAGRQKLIPLNKNNSDGSFKETDWRVANKEIINATNSLDSSDFRQTLMRNRRRPSHSRMPTRLPNSKPVLDDIKTPHPFAPD